MVVFSTMLKNYIKNLSIKSGLILFITKVIIFFIKNTKRCASSDNEDIFEICLHQHIFLK